MLALERQRKIIDLLNAQNGIRVSRLAREFDVTEETIRRDLSKLAADGKLIRTHGGAVANEGEAVELAFADRETANIGEKLAICRYAAGLIAEGDAIMLDASSTSFQLAQNLPDIALTVITNALAVATELVSRPKIKVICAGGQLDPLSLSFVGPLAEDTLLKCHARRAFISCKGVDLQRGLSVAAKEHGRLKRRMMDLADTSYLLLDHTKFGLRSTFFFAGLDEVDHIITDADVAPEVLRGLRDAGVHVDVAEL